MATRKKGGKNKALDIIQLKIYVDISVPNSTPFLLTSDTLSYTGSKKLEKYPLFVSTHKYPYAFLVNQKYDRIIEFFFIKKSFNSKLLYNVNPVKKATRKKIRGGNKNIGEQNFKWMLSLLFPISYPIKNNIYNSYDIVTNQIIWEIEDPVQGPVQEQGPVQDQNPFYDVFNRIINASVPQKQKISYIKYNKKEYTVTEVIWLNDFLNYPIYYDFFKTYELYEISKPPSFNNDELIKNTLKELVTINGWTEAPNIEDKYKYLDGLLKLVYSSQQSKEYGLSRDVNKSYYEIYKILKSSEVNNLTQEEAKKVLEWGERLISAYLNITNPYINPNTRIIVSKIAELYKKRQIKTFLEKFNETFDTKYIKSDEKQLLKEIAPNILKLGETIQDIKSRKDINSEIKYVLENPNGDNTGKSLQKYMEFVNSFIDGEGEKTFYSNKDIKILFDKVINTEKTNKLETKESYIELYILVNVIENKYDMNTISSIDCHYKDYELAMLSNHFKHSDQKWNMKARKKFFSDEKYKAEINKVYGKIKTPIPGNKPLELDNETLELKNTEKNVLTVKE